MDLTKYGASPYAAGSPLRGDQNTSILAAALRGLLGQDEPGSVLDPATANNRSINDKVNLASILSDITPAKALAGAAAKGAMLAGALRRGGRPDLYLSHGMHARGLLNEDKNIIRELMHPSFAITQNGPNPPWGDLYFIPREGKFDPATSNSSLHNMDTWTPGWHNSTYENRAYRNTINERLRKAEQDKIVNPAFSDPGEVGVTTPELLTDAQARLYDRFGNAFEKGGLNATGHEALASLRFPSFEAFENSPLGAGRLEGGKHAHPKVFKWLEKQSDEWGMSKPEILSAMAAGEFGPKKQSQAQEVVKLLRKTPQDYAELKQWGPVQLSPDNFAGVLVNSDIPDFKDITSILENKGLHVDEFYTGMDIPELGALADNLQERSLRSMTPRVPGASERARAAEIQANSLRGLTPTGEPKKVSEIPPNFDSWADWAKDYWHAWNTAAP